MTDKTNNKTDLRGQHAKDLPRKGGRFASPNANKTPEKEQGNGRDNASSLAHLLRKDMNSIRKRMAAKAKKGDVQAAKFIQAMLEEEQQEERENTMRFIVQIEYI